MSATKWTVIVTLAVLAVIGAAAALFKTISEKDLSFSNPVLSDDGRLLAFIRYKESRGEDGSPLMSAQLRVIDFERREKKEYFSIDLKGKEDMIIDGVSASEILYSVSDYETGASSRFRFSVKDGVSELIRRSKGEEFADMLVPCPSHPEMKVSLRYVSESKSSVLFVSETGAEVVILEIPAYEGYIYSPKWVGENIVFQAHVKDTGGFRNGLWFYQTGTGILSELERDCCSSIFSPDGKYAAILMPSNVNGRSLWEMGVKRLSGSDKPESLDTVCYDKEVFLYEWAPSSDGFLLQSGNSLCYYDMSVMKSKVLQDAEKDGWWGYPLSMYYSVFSPDGRKAAVLEYKENGGGYTESIMMIDVKTEMKKRVYSAPLSEFGKKQPFRPEFYRHIVWNRFNDRIIFESKEENDPDMRKIMMISPDGSGKKILSGSLL